MADYPVDNLIYAGLVLAIYLFIAILVYALISGPVGAVLNGISIGASYIPSVQPHASSIMPYIAEAVMIVFALGIAYPVVWFIFWVFAQEPDVNIFRRN